MKKLFVLMAVTVIALAGFTSMAGATLIFNLGIGNAAIAGFPGPYGSVSVTRTSATDATIQFTANTVGPYAYLFGDGGSFAININGTTGFFTLGTPTNSGAGFTPGPISEGGSGNEDGFGSFNATFNSFDGYTHTSTSWSFDVHQTAGPAWATDADVLAPNADGHYVAAHIFVTTNPALAFNGAVATGFATDGGTIPTPEPTSMLLLGLGLVGAGAARRRKKN